MNTIHNVTEQWHVTHGATKKLLKPKKTCSGLPTQRKMRGIKLFYEEFTREPCRGLQGHMKEG